MENAIKLQHPKTDTTNVALSIVLLQLSMAEFLGQQTPQADFSPAAYDGYKAQLASERRRLGLTERVANYLKAVPFFALLGSILLEHQAEILSNVVVPVVGAITGLTVQ